MGDLKPPPAWGPVAEAERYPALDAVRGLALLGVLLANLHTSFRVSYPDFLLGHPPGPAWEDRAVDLALAVLVHGKAYALFALLFGAGLAAFADRAAARRARPARLLARRLAVLLALGLGHLVLVWNGDILTLYAVCALLLLPALRLPAGGLAAAGLAALALPYVVPWGLDGPTEDELRELAAEGQPVYVAGGVADVVAHQWREARLIDLPILVAALPRTVGLMALGAAAWRAGVVADPTGHRRLLRAVAVAVGGVGGAATLVWALQVPTQLPPWLVEAAATVPLALGYAAGLLLALRSPAVGRAAAPVAAVGRMALTNYLAQSVALGLLFFGYGLGLHGRLGPAAACGVGLALYSAQVVASLVWLRWFRFGPAEWAWRSLTYGRAQPMRRAASYASGPAGCRLPGRHG